MPFLLEFYSYILALYSYVVVRKALVLENWGDIEIYQLYIAIHPKHTPNTSQTHPKL